jgi:hypothetical protein
MNSLKDGVLLSYLMLLLLPLLLLVHRLFVGGLCFFVTAPGHQTADGAAAG